MGKDKRLWRKLVKKLRRKRIRSEKAQKRDNEAKKGLGLECQSGNRIENESYITSNSDDEEIPNLKIEEVKWFERERQAQLHFEMKKAEEKKRLQQEQDEKDRIRREWDELEAKREAHEKEMKQLEDEKREKQDKEFNEFLDFLAGDIETPPLPFLMPEDPKAGEQATCPFFARTGACRFSVNCTRAHPRPTLSQIILIPNFFSHFALEQALLDEYDTDLILEYEDSELYKAFLEFYEDVMPEFKKIGEVIQFKVCCNLESHLRGNVYVQYKDIRQAVEAYRLFNGRFYNGRQLSLQFVKIDSWRSSICGLFTRKRCLLKRSCYFLHVFRNPTKEFVGADNDWKQLVRANSKFPIRPSATATSTAASTRNYSKRPSSSRERERSSSRTSRSSTRDSSRSTRGEIQTKSSRTPVPGHRDSPGKRRHSDDDDDTDTYYKHREDRYESHRKWDRTEAHSDKYLSLSYESDRSRRTSKTRTDQGRVDELDNEQPHKKKLKSKKEKKEKHKKHKKKKRKKDHKKSKKKEESEPASSSDSS